MKPPDEIRNDLVLQWLGKADLDFQVAQRLLVDNGFFREAVAFHCQQTVEKYLKALLVWHQVEFPKTHDLGRLLDRLAIADAATAASLRFAEILTRFAVEVRYPGDSAELLFGEDAEAMRIAQCVREIVTSALPL